MTPEQIVQANLDFYNQRNIDGFISLLSNDIKLVDLGESEATVEGLSKVKKMYDGLFTNSPELHSTIIKRIVIGNKVIDHESIIGRNGMSETLELVLIYEVQDKKIVKITVIRG